jgi:hypothetical protein
VFDILLTFGASEPMQPSMCRLTQCTGTLFSQIGHWTKREPDKQVDGDAATLEDLLPLFFLEENGPLFFEGF